LLRSRSKGVTIMTTEDKSKIPVFSPEDEKEAQKVPDHPNMKETLKVNHNWTGFQGKTLWDWMQLLGVLAIPLVVVGATLLFGIQQANLANQQHVNDQKIANQQHEADQQQALDQQQAAILQTYIDNIQDLLLHDNLRESKAGDEVAILARARTLTALQGLDPERKGRLVQFIYEAQLIDFLDAGLDKNNLHGPIIDLSGAHLSGADLSATDLSGADLSDAHLSGADLSGADLNSAHLNSAHLSDAHLSGADLSGATLISADLSNANLSGADLSGAHLSKATLSGTNLRYADLSNATLSDVNLSGADLSGAFLSGADLSGATLSDTDLSGAHLRDADLSGAHLSGAHLRDTDLSGTFLNGAILSGAQNLTQQQLDQVFTCKGAILPGGLACHQNL
jgi:uncharacterized protein YjbI with pentapeptide repeats